MDSIKIGPLRYKVRECEELKADDGRGMYAELDCPKSEIRLWAAITEDHRPVTLWHEALHAILIQAGMEKLSGNEQVISVLSHGIVQVLQDNPEMVKVGDG